MRITVDSEKCQGHNRCYSLAPELFDVDDYGYATEIGDGLARRPLFVTLLVAVSPTFS